jgi:hypothetical protein
MEVGDQSAELARAHAEALTQEIEARRKLTVEVPVFGTRSVELFDPVTFVATGDVIRARTHLPPPKVREITGQLERKAQERYRGK